VSDGDCDLQSVQKGGYSRKIVERACHTYFRRLRTIFAEQIKKVGPSQDGDKENMVVTWDEVACHDLRVWYGNTTLLDKTFGIALWFTGYTKQSLHVIICTEDSKWQNVEPSYVAMVEGMVNYRHHQLECDDEQVHRD
jgi:hypothetical protein